MADASLVSVIIPSYNSAGFLHAAVSSVLAQTYGSVEVIVVDDGSTDNTKEVVAQWQGAVRYVYQANAGVSKARNHGIKLANGALIAFLDADDQWMPEKLAKQCTFFAADPEVGLVHTDTYYWHELTGARTYVDEGRRRFSGNCHAEFFWHNKVIASTVVVRRDCLDHIGFFDEAIRGPSTEDMDLWIRISRRFKFRFVDEPLALYRVHPGNGSSNLRRMYEDELFVYAKAIKEGSRERASLGEKDIQAKLAHLAFGAGLENLLVGNVVRARKFLLSSLWYAPTKVATWKQLGWSFLPAAVRSSLKSLKHRWSL